MPQVLTEACFGGELSVVREMIVPLFGMQLAQVAFLVGDVEHDLKGVPS